MTPPARKRRPLEKAPWFAAWACDCGHLFDSEYWPDGPKRGVCGSCGRDNVERERVVLRAVFERRGPFGLWRHQIGFENREGGFHKLFRVPTRREARETREILS